jgi:DNA-binding NtrC family response regulator
MSRNQSNLDLQGISILIIDADTSNLRNLKRLLNERGAQVHLSSDLEGARSLLSRHMVHAALAEVNLPHGEGLETLKFYKSKFPNGLQYLMYSEPMEDPMKQLDAGMINGLFQKPVDVDLLANSISEHGQVEDTSVSKLDPLTELLRPYLIFRSPVMRRGLLILPRVATSPHSVLVTGETGSGKEMVARAIHGLSPFANGPFVAVNCGAIPETLIEGELFGHEKGAFTGAHTLHKGKFELARNGTLFLDEIGEMPLVLQARLLRVLEERQLYRIGGEKPVNINVRVVAATQVNLEKAVEDKLFRDDLYYRLNVLRVHIPALRERVEDIPLLAWHFLERAFLELNRQKPYPVLSAEAIALLIQQPWKGNVRELKNLMTRLAVLIPGTIEQITSEHLIAYFPEGNMTEVFVPRDTVIQHQPLMDDDQIIEISSYPSEEGVFIPMGTTMKEAESMIIKATLKHTKENRTQAAKVLDIGLRTIRRKINELKEDDELVKEN